MATCTLSQVLSKDKPTPMRPINNEIRAFEESMQAELWRQLGEQIDPELRDRLFIEFNEGMQPLRDDISAIEEQTREQLKNVKPEDIERVAKQLLEQLAQQSKKKE